MSEQWIVRVQGKEYGPVDLETLREWKKEGRVLASNETRGADVDLWTTADKIPGLFAPEAKASVGVLATPKPGEGGSATDRPHGSHSLFELLADTWRIYLRGFPQFFFLTALVTVPSICAQLSGAAIGSPPSVEIDMRTALIGMFNLCMVTLSLAAWPVYIAGIQILTVELSCGRQIGVVDLVQRALAFWPRVLGLCVIVYGVFFLLTVFGIGVAVILAASGSSIAGILFALGLLALQVWLFGRWFINTLFWQQFAVIDKCGVAMALRQSKELARSGRDLVWHRRPLWRGAILASLWFALVLLLNANQIWLAIDYSFRAAATATDPQALLQSMSEHAKNAGFNWLSFSLWIVQKILQPLLGIAFVLLYYESTASRSE